MTTENPNPTNDAEAAAAAADPAQAPPAGEGGGDEAAATGDSGTVLGGEGEAAPGAEADGEKDAGEGDGGDAEAAVGPPETYELTVPDGFEKIDADVLAEATPVLKELNLTNEQADKLTPIAAGLVKKTLERAEKAITDRAVTQRREWNDAFEADPEIGGANKDATVAAAARAFDHYGLKKGEGLRQLLDESGIGNHPDMIRFVAAVGRDLAEGGFERGDAVTTTKAPEQKMYGAEFQPKAGS